MGADHCDVSADGDPPTELQLLGRHGRFEMGVVVNLGLRPRADCVEGGA
jgi:hypothetical protein